MIPPLVTGRIMILPKNKNGEKSEKNRESFANSPKSVTFAPVPQRDTPFDSVAQLVEQMTLNHWVESSSLSGVTTKEQLSHDSCFFIPPNKTQLFKKKKHLQDMILTSAD